MDIAEKYLIAQDRVQRYSLDDNIQRDCQTQVVINQEKTKILFGYSFENFKNSDGDGLFSFEPTQIKRLNTYEALLSLLSLCEFAEKVQQSGSHKVGYLNPDDFFMLIKGGSFKETIYCNLDINNISDQIGFKDNQFDQFMQCFKESNQVYDTYYQRYQHDFSTDKVKISLIVIFAWVADSIKEGDDQKLLEKLQLYIKKMQNDNPTLDDLIDEITYEESVMSQPLSFGHDTHISEESHIKSLRKFTINQRVQYRSSIYKKQKLVTLATNNDITSVLNTDHGSLTSKYTKQHKITFQDDQDDQDDSSSSDYDVDEKTKQFELKKKQTIYVSVQGKFKRNYITHAQKSSKISSLIQPPQSQRHQNKFSQSINY